MPSSSPKTPRHGFDLETFALAGPRRRGNVSADGEDSAPPFWSSISAVQLKPRRVGDVGAAEAPPRTATGHGRAPAPGKPTANCTLGNNTCPARHGGKRVAPARLGPAASGWDTAVAPGWWPEPDTSQHGHHPALPARNHRAHQGTRPGTAPADSGFAFGRQGSSDTACPFPRGLERHEAVKSPTGCHGSTQHRERTPAAAPASQRSTAAGASHRDQTPPGNADPGSEEPRHYRMHLISSIPTAPPLYRGRGSLIARERAVGELGSSRCIAPALARTT